jgi:1-acyl-sn-glycerol-3-phosphate acyltransferase
MSLLDSIRVLGAMARVTAPTIVDMLRDDVERGVIDERTRWFGRRVVDLLEVDLSVEGAHRVPTDGGAAYIYMSNHQSHLDIPMLYASLPAGTIRMLAKTELFQIPIWGRGIRAAEFIEVDRSNSARARESIAYAARLVREGVSIYLAPEGTRSRDGSIGRLKKGGFHLAMETGAPIVPVAVRGTIDILPRGRKSMRTGRRVEVTIGEPIDVAGRDLEGLMTDVRDFLVQNVENGRSNRT